MIGTRPLIYVIAPYSSVDPLQVQRNVLAAREVGAEINDAGGFALVPHNLGLGLEHTLSPDGWYELTEEVLSRCDGAVVLSGSNSRGCLAELERAKACGIPVLDSRGDVHFFVENLTSRAEVRHGMQASAD